MNNKNNKFMNIKNKKNTLITNVLIGTDLEFLLTKKNEFYPAFHVTKASKDNPLELLNLGVGYKMHYDNVGLEIALPPSKIGNAEEFIANVNAGLSFLKEFAKNNDCQISNESVAVFKDEYLHHDEGMKSGCEPDFNVWQKTINDAPNMELDIRCVGKIVCQR